MDITKDRVYTCKSDSLARRSAQTAQYHIAQALVRWIAPILSFTADEIWDAIPGKREASVFEEEWYPLPQAAAPSELNETYWDFMADVKVAVNKALEQKRNEGGVGKSLEADAILYCDSEIRSALEKLENELRFVLITSKAELKKAEEAKGVAESEISGLYIDIQKSAAQKCERCWHHRDDVGVNPNHPSICGRCVENVEGGGEERFYA